MASRTPIYNATETAIQHRRIHHGNTQHSFTTSPASTTIPSVEPLTHSPYHPLQQQLHHGSGRQKCRIQCPQPTHLCAYQVCRPKTLKSWTCTEYGNIIDEELLVSKEHVSGLAHTKFIRGYKLVIDTDNSKPVCCRQPTYGFHRSKIIKEQLKTFLRN
jgi:hypothetical protein